MFRFFLPFDDPNLFHFLDAIILLLYQGWTRIFSFCGDTSQTQIAYVRVDANDFMGGDCSRCNDDHHERSLIGMNGGRVASGTLFIVADVNPEDSLCRFPHVVHRDSAGVGDVAKIMAHINENRECDV